MSSQDSRLYDFGDFRIDLRKGLLLRGGRPLPVPPKAFDTLIALVESDGRVIGKDELMNRVWGDSFVEENNLTQQISLLRKLLQDTDQSLIETVPRRGYRFAAEVRKVTETNTPGSEAAPSPVRSRARFVWVTVLVAALAAIGAIAVQLRPSRRDMPRSIAVLPFKPLVSGAGDVYLEMGMADALITELSNIREIRVRPTSSVLGYANAADPAAVGRKLGVEAVLEGRIQRSGERVRVTAQLIRVSDGEPLWAGKFDEELNNILAVQDAISLRIVSALTLELSGQEQRFLNRRATESAEAYQLYLRGRYHWFRWSPEGWAHARDYFEQAVAKDPKFALAWVGLADAVSVQMFIRPATEVVPQGKVALERALALDGALADAHSSAGAIALFYDWDRAEAKHSLLRALELNPNHALSHDLLALLHASDGRFAEAIAQSRRALELDPTSPYMNTDLGTIYYYHRSFDQAERHVRTALAIDPNYVDGLRYLASIEEQRKNDAAAIDAWAKVVTLSGDPEVATAMRAGFASSGYSGAIQRWLDALTEKSTHAYVPPLELAELHARLDHREQAFHWLAKAREERAPA